MFVIRYILRNLDQYRPRFWIAFSAGVVDGFVVFFIPVLLAEFTRVTVTAAGFRQLVGLLIGCYVVSLLLQWYIRRFGEGVSTQFSFYLRLKYFRALERLPVKHLVNRHSGYILSLINHVSRTTERAIMNLFWTYSTSIGTIVLFFIFTARESVALGLFNLAIMLFFIILSTLLSRRMVEIFADVNKKASSLLESFADFMANILTIKKLALYSFAESRLAEKTATINHRVQTLQDFHSRRWLMLHALYGTAFLSTIAFMLWRISQGTLPASVLILFIAAYAAIRGTVERMSENFRLLMELKAYITTLEEIVPLDIAAPFVGEHRGWSAISMRNVRFLYPEARKTISIPRFTLQRGEIIGVMGTSGEGKTTLLNLLANFYDPDQGERRIDGRLYQDVGIGFFQSRVVMISQEVDLFNTSLRDNITLGKKIAENELRKALAALDLLVWADHLERGLETLVGEKGVKLSSGQKQRINLLRGILLNRDIILLDEPTSHLDAATEKKVVTFLAGRLRGKTAVIVSHRDAVLRLCARCYTMERHVLREITNTKTAARSQGRNPQAAAA